jgi:hypothetical protein
MGCGAEGDVCLNEHVFPWLKDPRPAGKLSYRALATCHNDTSPSMSVSWLDERIQWNCFTCKDKLGNEDAQIATRNALIRSGVPARCLPQGKADAESQLNTIRDILGHDGKPAQRLFRIAAILGGWGGELPAGDDLEALADSCRVSHRTGYDTRRATHNR